MKQAEELLTEAHKVLAERGEHYNDGSERNMVRIVDAFNAVTGHLLTTHEGWMFMVCLKLVRASFDLEFKADHYIDGVNYFALAGEEHSASKVD